MTKKLSKSQHIRNILTQYPDMKPADVATRANSTVKAVYSIRWMMKNEAKQPIAQAVATVKHKVTAKSVNTRSISIKEACEVLQTAVKDIAGLDIKVWDDTVLFDHDGNLYETTAADAYKVLYAIKTLHDAQV